MDNTLALLLARRGGSGGDDGVIEALGVPATGECTAMKAENGCIIATVAVPTKNYNNAEGVNF